MSTERRQESNGAVRETIGYACGKVIVLGEHAVVYGIPAIAAGIDRGARARATPIAGNKSRLRVSGWEVEVRDDQEPHDLARAFQAVLEATRVAHASRNGTNGNGAPGLQPVLVEAEADLAPGGGLGCSAALGVAVARALDPSANDAQITERAMAWERVFHGNPSGIDAAVAAGGGFVHFKKGEGIEALRARGPLLFCVGNTGIPSSTKTMVEAVARLRERRPEVVEKAFEGIRVLVQNARVAIEAGDRAALGRLMDLNQMLLSGLFVSTEEIERMCDRARAVGALGAKLTGAGGGGSVIALVPNVAVAERVLEAWRKDGFTGFATKVAQPAPAPAIVSETAP